MTWGRDAWEAQQRFNERVDRQVRTMAGGNPAGRVQSAAQQAAPPPRTEVYRSAGGGTERTAGAATLVGGNNGSPALSIGAATTIDIPLGSVVADGASHTTSWENAYYKWDASAGQKPYLYVKKAGLYLITVQVQLSGPSGADLELDFNDANNFSDTLLLWTPAVYVTKGTGTTPDPFALRTVTFMTVHTTDSPTPNTNDLFYFVASTDAASGTVDRFTAAVLRV